MPVVKDRVQKISTVNRIPSHFLNDWPHSFFEDHLVVEFIALFNPDIFPHYIINIVIGIEDFNLYVKQAGLTLDSYKVARNLVKQFAIDVNLHVRAFVCLDGNTGNVCVRAPGSDRQQCGYQ